MEGERQEKSGGRRGPRPSVIITVLRTKQFAVFKYSCHTTEHSSFRDFSEN